MLRLIYKSFEAVPFNASDLTRLLASSRLRNVEAGLTGILIYDKGTFLQALEGDPSSMQTTFARIERDARHKDITVLLREPDASKRMFGNWSMGYADGLGAASILKGFVDLPNGLKTATLDRSSAVRILDAVASRIAA
jgi:Sensors of blue-light using FAD